jgi:hypothetical protein
MEGRNLTGTGVKVGVHLVQGGVLDRIRILLIQLGTVCGKSGWSLASLAGEVLKK